MIEQLDDIATSPEYPRVGKVTFLFQKHALMVYLVLSFLISWVFWFIEPGLRSGDGVTSNFFIQLGTFGPIFAAMFVSVFQSSERQHTHLWQRFLAGGLALAAAVFSNWLLAKYIFGEALQPVNVFLLALLTLIPAWIFFNARSSRLGVHKLLNSLTRINFNPLWLAVAFFLMPMLSAVGVLLTSLITSKPLTDWITSLQANPIIPSFALAFFATALYGGPLGEEAGWRSFLLPQLQKRFDPLLASVYLGLIWGIWHLPLHVTGYYNQVFGSSWGGLLLRLFTTIPLAIIFTWLYNRTHGNLLVTIVLHTMVNITSGLVPPEIGMYITMTIAVVMMVIIDRMYKKPDTNMPAQSSYPLGQ